MRLTIAEDMDQHACMKAFILRKGNKCDCCARTNPCSSCRRFKRFETFFRCTCIAFASMGLQLAPPSKTVTSRLKTLASTLISILMHLFMAYRCLVLYYRIKNAGYTIMTALFLIAREALVLAIWHSVFAQREKIMELFKCMSKISQLFPCPKSKRLEKLFYVLLAGIYVFPIFVSSLMAGTLSFKEAEQYQLVTTFGIVTKASPHSLNFLLYCMYNYYLLTLPFVVSLVYVYLCINLRKMLDHCARGLQNCRSFKKVDRVLRQSIRLSFLIEKTEEALSVCIFWVVALNLTLSFTSIAYGLGYYEATTSATSGVLAWFFANQASFVLIVWTASDVKNESMNLKREFQLVLYDLEQSDTTSSLFFQKICIFDSIALTGWQMFDFSKGLILSAFGSILTYGLLILQAEKYTYSRAL